MGYGRIPGTRWYHIVLGILQLIAISIAIPYGVYFVLTTWFGYI